MADAPKTKFSRGGFVKGAGETEGERARVFGDDRASLHSRRDAARQPGTNRNQGRVRPWFVFGMHGMDRQDPSACVRDASDRIGPSGGLECTRPDIPSRQQHQVPEL